MSKQAQHPKHLSSRHSTERLKNGALRQSALQPKTAGLHTQPAVQGITRSTPVAPPVYRPQLVSKTLQAKTAQATQKARQPNAPPVYRPQPMPKVMQTKMAAGQQSQANQSPRRPVAPPIYRPEPKRIVQPKMAATESRVTPRLLPAYRPQLTPKVLQTKESLTQIGPKKPANRDGQQRVSSAPDKRGQSPYRVVQRARAKVAEPTVSNTAQALSISGMPQDYQQFLFPGGTVYRRSNTDPLLVFKNGFVRNGYTDLIKHVTVEQGKGSNWISTTTDLVLMDERYGKYAYEIELKWYQGVDTNKAYQAIVKHRNPHAEQNEVAVWHIITPDQITAVWVPKDKSKIKLPDKGAGWSDYYERYTKQAYIDMVS